MKYIISEKKAAILILILFSLLFFFISYNAEATYDAGDGIRHYLISRYCWQHPDLLLYSWGKPFFTIISSPFSQFGLIGMNVFNILCAMGSAYFTFKIAKLLKLNYALLAIPFLLFTPCYFPTINSGLTEPLFGFILITSIYLFFIEKYVLASIIVSLLPFVRSEGNLILPLFFIILLYRKRFFTIPFLGFGTLAYSIIGFFYYNDFFWIKNQNPYNGANKAFYGSGELLHFVNNYNFLLGTTLTILFVIGLIAIVPSGYKTIVSKKLKEGKLPEELILIYGSFLIYFLAHSIMWWKGLANSLGLLRVIAGVVPCSVIICLRGLNLLMIPSFKKTKIVEYALLGILLLLIIRSPFKHDYFPYKLDQEQSLVKQAGDWYKGTTYTKQKVYYLYPLLAHVMDVNPFDATKVGELWGLYPTIKEWGIGAVPDSTIILWDAHFGPNECRIPLDTIMNDPNFKLIKTFKPEVEFTTLGGYKFEIYAFMKLPKPRESKELFKLTYDFEENKDLENTTTISEKEASSGKKSCELSEKNEFSATIKINGNSINKNCTQIKFNSKYLNLLTTKTDGLVVFSIDNLKENKNMVWESKSIESLLADDTKNWQSLSTSFYVPQEFLNENYSFSIYVWNKTKQNFYVDDFEISFWGVE